MEAIMNRNQLSHLVAACTGESRAVIRRLGFQLEREPRDEPEAEEIRLVVHCPFCRGAVPYPGRSRDGSATHAECADCDVYFEFAPRRLPGQLETSRRPVTRQPPLHPGLIGSITV
jgi:hypothetical protein